MGINKNLVYDALDEVKKVGVKDAEVYAETTRLVELSIDGTEINNVRVLEDIGIAIRAYNKGGMGFAYVMQLGKNNVKLAAQRACELAKSAQKDKFFKSLPKPSPLPKIKGLYDSKLSVFPIKKLVKLTQGIIDSAKNVDKDVTLRAELSVILDKESRIVNSNGIDCHERQTAISAYAMAKVQRSKEDVGSGMEFFLSRSIDGLDTIPNIGKIATERAVRNLGAEKTKTRKCFFLLSPYATMGLVSSILASCLNGVTVSYGLSCLRGKLGQKIASDKLTIIDNGCLNGGFMSSHTDGEGSPRKPFYIFEKGVLKNYLHTSYSAGKMKQKNTASAMRHSYTHPPLNAGVTNIKVAPGEKSFNEILKSVDDGIYIDSLHTIDVLTGSISSMIDYGIEIKSGELKNAIKSAMIGTNLLEILKNIVAISKDVKDFCGSTYPYILVEGINIGG